MARTRPRTAIADLVRQDNRTKYLVYAYEGTEPHDPFLNSLFRRLPRGGITRPRLKQLVRELGRGRYEVYYNSIVVGDAAAARRRLFAAPEGTRAPSSPH